MNDEQLPPIWLEIAAALLVPAAALGFSRVFIEQSTVLPIIGAALLSSAVAVLARRLRIPLPLAAVISLGLLAALVVNRYAPGTARFGVIPTGETLDRFQLLSDELVTDFQELKTPVPALQPFVAAAMVGAWLMAFLTDWGAMRLRLAFEPVLPSALLFIFTSIPPISAGDNVVMSTVVFAAAVALWAVAQRSANLLQRGVWLAHHHRRGPASIAASGAVVAAMAVLAGALLGPRLPGADDDPLYSFADQGDPTRVVVSPYVNIRSRLVSQTSQELFTVAADKPTYWRIAGLDTYEDDIWKVAGDFSPESGRLPGQREFGGEVTVVAQDFSISALAAIWLPAAFAPSEIEATTAEVTWNAENSSLTVANNVENSDGVQYSLLSNVPAFSVDELRSATETIPGDIAERYLGLPTDLTPEVEAQARAITAGATTRYDQAKALQDHFRGYEYSVRLGARVGDPVEQFLEERRGFCQQFAGTFALMARALGIPSRIATGFTWGDPVGSDPDSGKTVYRVTGRHTHAWPEVYFDDLGWVAFEPTPGRGLPGAENYTQAPAAQDSDIQPNNPGGPTTTTTIDPSANTPVTPAPNLEGFEEGLVAEQVADGGSGGFSIPWRVVLVALVLLTYLIGMPAIWLLRRRNRRAAATTPAQKVEVAWADALESLELGFDLRRHPAETRQEFATRLDSDRRVPSDRFTGLAEAATIARFHPDGVSAERAAQARRLSTDIEQSMNSRVPIHVRYRRLLDPRRLFKRSKRTSDGNGVGGRRSPLPKSFTDEAQAPSGDEGQGRRLPVGAGRR